jgi:hypothetical protein
MNGKGSLFAILDGSNRQILTAGNAITTRPDA